MAAVRPAGAQIDLELRAAKGGFWVEASGHARGEMALSWAPPQWEGMLGMWGRIPNSTLRLNSSIRFGEDGSLTSGFMEGGYFWTIAIPRKRLAFCVDLTGVEPGYSYLDDGSLYWNHPSGEPVETSDGVALAEEDLFEVITPGSDPGSNDDNGGDGSVVVITHPPDKRVPDYV